MEGLHKNELRQPSSSQRSLLSEKEDIGALESQTKTQRLLSLPSKTKEKTKNFLHANSQGEPDQNPKTENNEGLGLIENDPAFKPSLLDKQKSMSFGGTPKKARESLRAIVSAVVHPKESIKRKATQATAGKLSSTQRPYLSRNADLNFLKAHSELDQATSSRSSRHTSSDDEGMDLATHECQEKVNEIEAHRESLRVAWTTSRHINRVRVVPRRRFSFPDNTKFSINNDNGVPYQFDWLKWLGYNILFYTQNFSSQYIDDFDELPFDVNSLQHHIERVVAASAPWQSWAMEVRSVYRWEHPKTTGKWLAIYIALWYSQHIMGFVYAYIIFHVIRNRFFPTNIKSLQKSMDRALDSEGKASKFGELIDKHGRDSWLEPLIDDLGPYMQLQISDIANMLEVFHNFHHWKSPRKTAASLSFLMSCLLVSLFADMKFCMKIVWFIVGGCFFFCWPIASLYPKYRYLVSPFKWVLWDIPTDAEWSFQYLRRQAQISREQIIQRKVDQAFKDRAMNHNKATHDDPSASSPTILGPSNNTAESDEDWQSAVSSTVVLNETDFLSFRAHSHGATGRLIVYSEGLRFAQSVTRTEKWRRSYLELVEMRKLKGSALSRLTRRSLEQLELTFIDGDVCLLDGIKDRDAAFNAIIGFSALKWQALQTDPTDNARTSEDCQ